MGLIRNRMKLVNKPKCEKCGAPLIPIVYGYPSGAMFRDAERGKIALGGCVIMGNDSRWKCTASCDLKNNDEEINS